MFGDAAVQGPWSEIRERLVIVDATHARRPWRLAFTQALELPAPVEWIGWWLKTPDAQCHAMEPDAGGGPGAGDQRDGGSPVPQNLRPLEGGGLRGAGGARSQQGPAG